MTYTLNDFADGSFYSDVHKDAYGFRPRGHTFESEEEFHARMEELIEISNRVAREEEMERDLNRIRLIERVKDR